MIIFKSHTLSKKDKLEIMGLLSEMIDEFGDFYITRDNIRLYIHQNQDILFNSLSKGNKLVYSYEYGIALIDGYADNAKRKYIKILARNPKSANKLLSRLLSKIKDTFYIKVKKNSSLIPIIKSNKFQFKGDRGKEILFYKEKYRGDINA